MIHVLNGDGERHNQRVQSLYGFSEGGIEEDDDEWGAESQGIEFVHDLRLFEAGLNMTTRAAVRRQLAIDIPRSKVFVNGVPTVCANHVYKSSHSPRICTQASLASLVEYIVLHKRALCMELNRPMLVYIDKHITRIAKDLCLLSRDDLSPIGNVALRVCADAANNFCVTSLKVSRFEKKDI